MEVFSNRKLTIPLITYLKALMNYKFALVYHMRLHPPWLYITQLLVLLVYVIDKELARAISRVLSTSTGFSNQKLSFKKTER